jgi:hypothetical protein
MSEVEILRKAVLYAIEELDTCADFLGGEGYFTLAKSIKIDVLHKLQTALDESKRDPGQGALK